MQKDMTSEKLVSNKLKGFKKGDMVNLYWEGKHQLEAKIAKMWIDGVSLLVEGEGWHTFRGSCVELSLVESQNEQLSLF